MERTFAYKFNREIVQSVDVKVVVSFTMPKLSIIKTVDFTLWLYAINHCFTFPSSLIDFQYSYPVILSLEVNMKIPCKVNGKNPMLSLWEIFNVKSMGKGIGKSYMKVAAPTDPNVFAKFV